MLSNFLATAWRNLARNRAYAVVGIFGLALGLCAALCAALVLRDQLGYDRFIDGYERTYTALSVLMPQGRAPLYDAATHNSAAALLKLRFPQIAKDGTTVVMVTHSLTYAGYAQRTIKLLDGRIVSETLLAA